MAKNAIKWEYRVVKKEIPKIERSCKSQQEVTSNEGRMAMMSEIAKADNKLVKAFTL